MVTYEILDFEGHKYEGVDDVLLDSNNMIFIKLNYIHKTK